jgi:hypothetical protein
LSLRLPSSSADPTACNAPIDMCLKELPGQAGRRHSCLALVGCSGATWPAALNDLPSQLRAEHVKRQLERNSPSRTRRLIARDAGLRETKVSDRRDEASDALNRRVDFKVPGWRAPPVTVTPKALPAAVYAQRMRMGVAIMAGLSSALAAAFASPVCAGDAKGAHGPGLDAIVQAARADAARRGAVSPEVFETVSAERVTWSDGSLGCPQPDRMYTQALVPGYRVRLRGPAGVLDYHASQRGALVLCPPGQAMDPVPGESRI